MKPKRRRVSGTPFGEVAEFVHRLLEQLEPDLVLVAERVDLYKAAVVMR